MVTQILGKPSLCPIFGNKNAHTGYARVRLAEQTYQEPLSDLLANMQIESRCQIIAKSQVIQAENKEFGVKKECFPKRSVEDYRSFLLELIPIAK